MEIDTLRMILKTFDLVYNGGKALYTLINQNTQNFNKITLSLCMVIYLVYRILM